MKFEEMMNIAKHIMLLNPNYILCGSLAMIYKGLIPPRDVRDIDFVCLRENFDETKLHIHDEDYSIKENDGYKCYNTYGDSDGMFYNVFVFDNSMDVTYEIIDDMLMQEDSQMLRYKKEYNRLRNI